MSRGAANQTIARNHIRCSPDYSRSQSLVSLLRKSRETVGGTKKRDRERERKRDSCGRSATLIQELEYPYIDADTHDIRV